MTERRSVRWLSLAGIAFAGVLVGHWLTYVVAVPDPLLRAQVLASSGHAYWHLAVELGTIACFIGLGAAFLRGVDRRLRRTAQDGEPFVLLVGRLALLQLLAFMAMEVAERLVAGVPVGLMFGHHVFLVGLAIQVLLAWAGGFVALLCGRAGQATSSALGHVALPRFAALVPMASVAAGGRNAALLPGGPGLRGPPPR